MKRSACLLVLASVLGLSACGAYIGSPPKTEVHETKTTETPPAHVDVYTP